MGKTAAGARTQELNIGPRNFRHNQDIENFFRFVYENGLRAEARKMFDIIIAAQNAANAKSKRKRRKKTLQ